MIQIFRKLKDLTIDDGLVHVKNIINEMYKHKESIKKMG